MKVRITTSGLKQLDRELGIDHATEIFRLLDRGYQVWAMPREGHWSMQWTPISPGEFVNGPHSNIREMVYYSTERWDLSDQPVPEWITTLQMYLHRLDGTRYAARITNLRSETDAQDEDADRR